MPGTGTTPGKDPLLPVPEALCGVRGWGRYADLPTDRTLVMGVLNVTPDSFSDGGHHDAPEAAVAHALRLVQQGADLIDVGGESTRPGSVRIPPQEEQRRILEVVRTLAAQDVVLSVDTVHPETARAVLEAGAQVVNDVSGTSLSTEMVELVRETGAPYVLMHSRGTPATMDSLARYQDTVSEVLGELVALRERMLAAGVRAEQIILDPGLGFAKGGTQDWELLRALDQFTALGSPVLVAASRKRFLGAALAQDRSAAAGREVTVPPQERDVATAAVSALAAWHGAWAVRVHDVVGTADALGVVRRWRGQQHVLSPSVTSGATL